MLDLVVKNGTVVTGGHEVKQDVGVVNGTVEALYSPGEAPPAREEIDATDCYVMPGFVDSHVHCRAPARPDRETWQSATKAAAAGGVTTIIEMPTSSPPASTPEAVRNRRITGEAACYVDFALYAGGAVADAESAQALAEEGIVGYKIFSHAPPPNRLPEFVGLCAPDYATLFSSLSSIATTGLPCVVHSEDESLLEWGVDRMRKEGRTDILAHADSRPPYVETAAIGFVLVLAEELGIHLHLPHVSTSWGVRLATQAKERGVNVTVETCPHYLLFDRDDMVRTGLFSKLNPPLRSAEDQQALWDEVRDGGIDILSSDHSPYLKAEKENADVWSAPSGHPELDAAFPGILSRVVEGSLTYRRAVELLSANPARIFGLDGKGAIEAGKDADFVIFDPRQTWTFRKEDAFSGVRDTYLLYDGQEMHGRVVRTVCRGATVYVDGKITGQEGHGRLVRPGRRPEMASAGSVEIAAST